MRLLHAGWIVVVLASACSRNAREGGAAVEAAPPATTVLPDIITCRDRSWPAVLSALDAYCAGAIAKGAAASQRTADDRARDCSTTRHILARTECAALQRRARTFDLVAADFEVRFRVDANGVWSVDEVLAGF